MSFFAVSVPLLYLIGFIASSAADRQCSRLPGFVRRVGIASRSNRLRNDRFCARKSRFNRDKTARTIRPSPRSTAASIFILSKVRFFCTDVQKPESSYFSWVMEKLKGKRLPFPPFSNAVRSIVSRCSKIFIFPFSSATGFSKNEKFFHWLI